MKKLIAIKKYLPLLIILIIVFGAFTARVEAVQTIDPTIITDQTDVFRLGAGFADAEEDKGLSTIIAGGIQIMLSILAILFIILMIVSGFKWMTAGGNEEQVTKAKKNIVNAIVGLFIVLAAYGITWFIFTYLPLTAGSPGGVQ